MKSKIVKAWLITACSLAGLAIVYYIIRLIDLVANPNRIEGTLLHKLNPYAIILLALALVMVVVLIPLSKKIEDYEAKKSTKVVHDHEILSKYKSKKTK